MSAVSKNDLENRALKKTEKERGTVLLTTLLIMAVMAAVSVAIMDDIRFAVKRVINVGDYAQADWYVKGAEDFAASYISETLIPLPDEAKNQSLQEPQVYAFPFDGGAMTLNVKDGTHCFSLGSLVTAEGAQNSVGLRQFSSLLIALGWPENEASNLGAVLTDWIDIDSQRITNGAEDGDYLRRTPPHRTANTVLASVMELRSLEIMTEDLYQSIRPFLCARDAGELTKFNIDTATPLDAFVLSSLLGGPDYLQTAIQLIAERPAGGYGNFEAMDSAPAMSGFDSDDRAAPEQFVFSPEKLWVEAQINYRNANRVVVFEFDTLDNGGANLTYRGWGSENLRPVIKDPNELPE